MQGKNKKIVIIGCFDRASYQKFVYQGFSVQSILPKSDLSSTGEELPSEYSLLHSSSSEKPKQYEASVSSKIRKSESSVDPLNNRVMLIDGTAIIYRSYYKILGNVAFYFFLLLNNF